MVRRSIIVFHIGYDGKNIEQVEQVDGMIHLIGRCGEALIFSAGLCVFLCASANYVITSCGLLHALLLGTRVLWWLSTCV